MPTTDPDKVYVKKHKINDMLNALYKSLVAEKPDDPIDFAFRHFESKVLKMKEVTVPKIIEEAKPEPGAAVNPNILLAKLMEKQKQQSNEATDNLNVSAAAKSTASSRVLSQYSIMVFTIFLVNFHDLKLFCIWYMKNKVNRVFASQQVTNDSNEDILEAENFVISRQDNEEDDEQSRKKMWV